MCGGVQFDINGQTIKTFFPNPRARLPVLSRNGSLIQVPWGIREQQPGRSPLGGWARLESIKTGIWERFNPKPVKIVVDAFMEKDSDDNSCHINNRWPRLLNAHNLPKKPDRLI